MNTPRHLIEDPTGDPPARLRIEPTGPGAVALSGEVDMTQCAALRAAFETAAPAGSPLTVDLRDVDYLDSAGVSALVEQSVRPLRLLVRTGSVVATVVEICGLPGLAQVEFTD